MIHVFVGTKPEYVKMAPLLQRMDAEGVNYRLIDSGQHAELSATCRGELGLKDPDVQLGLGHDIKTVPTAVRWMLGLLKHLGSRSRLQQQIFGGSGGICVVHGDTPTTLVSALLARRAGLALAHVEAGLRTFRWFHPFPEEIVRVRVGRMADVLFAPGPVAAHNLRSRGVKGRIIEQAGNTLVESVRDNLQADDERRLLKGDSDTTVAGDAGTDSPVVVTMHRVENLHLKSRRQQLIDILCEIVDTQPVRWVMHGPTERILAGEPEQHLRAAGVELVPHASRTDFLRMLAAAPFAITDGGSIQEECAMLGVPALLWRDSTDRGDGLGHNVVLSHYDPGTIADFLADPDRFRRPCQIPAFSPTEEILDVLAAWK